MKNLTPIQDGDTAAFYQFPLRREGAALDLNYATAEAKIYLEDGTFVGTRPLRPVGAKTDGIVELCLTAYDTDWNGSGQSLVIRPKTYVAMKDDTTLAPNVLVNPSFDTYTGGSGIADGWSLGGTLAAMVYTVNTDDPWPPFIYGKCQRSYLPSAGSTGFITQNPNATIVAGDYVSGWLWVRVKKAAGAALTGAEYYYEVMSNRPEFTRVSLPDANTQWKLITFQTLMYNSYSNIGGFDIVNLNAPGYEMRYDEACCFVGKIAVTHSSPFRVRAKKKSRIPRTTQAYPLPSSGVSGFEFDSNADGVCDGWWRVGSGNTYTHEKDPDHCNFAYSGSLGSQKVTLANSTTEVLRLIKRMNFLSGETWRFQVKYKNSGALTGSPANGDFGLVVHSEEFDGLYDETSLAGANFLLTSQAAFTNKSRDLTFTSNHCSVVVEVRLKGVSGGDMWLDDLEFFKL